MSPLWLLERLPVIVGFQTKFEHPVWLSLLLRDQAMTRDEYAVSGEVKTTIPLVVRGVTEEEVAGGARR